MSSQTWKEYYICEKCNFLQALGKSIPEIIIKYKEDLEKLISVNESWRGHRDYGSYLSSCHGLNMAIEQLERSVEIKYANV